ncbi:MAG: hypothetical protein QXV69_06980 [Sulfolobaceae archaeon]
METEFYRFALIRNYLSKVIQSIEGGKSIKESVITEFDDSTKSRICKEDINEEVIYNLAKEVSEFILVKNIDESTLHEIAKEVIRLCRE